MDYSTLSDDELDRLIAERVGYRHVPEYSTDLNAAIQLFKQTSEREDAALRYEDGGWACEIEIEGGSVAYLYSDELEPARVICLTWLQWDDIRNRS